MGKGLAGGDRGQDVLLGVADPDARSAALLTVVAIDRRLRVDLTDNQRPEVARRLLSIRENIGEDEAALVSTIQEWVLRAAQNLRNAR